jgi:hypothetical protein
MINLSAYLSGYVPQLNVKKIYIEIDPTSPAINAISKLDSDTWNCKQMQMYHMINILSQHGGLNVVSRKRVIKVLTRTLRRQHQLALGN